MRYEDIEAVNISTLRAMGQSPAHYLSALAQHRASTRAMDLGTATHLLALEPDRAETEIVVWEGGDRRGKAWLDFAAANAGALILKPAELAGPRAMAAAVRTHPVAAELLAQGAAEQTLLWTDAETGLDCKGRVDWVGDGLLVELKTARRADPWAFARQVATLGYHLQWAFYADGLAALTGRTPDVYCVVVESSAPWDVVVYRVSEDTLAVGREQYRALLRRLRACVEADDWPGQAPGVVDFLLPSWAIAARDEADVELTMGGEPLTLGG